MNSQYKTLKIPPIHNFEVEYYYSQEAETREARVFPPHLHDKIEAYVLIEGDASFMVENSLYKMENGDVIITKPNEMHNCILNTNSYHRHMCFWFDSTCSYIFDTLLSHPFGIGNKISPTPENKKRLYEICEQIEKAEEEGKDFRRFYLFLELIDIFNSSVSLTSHKSLPFLLKEILDDINVNFASIKTLSYFSEKYFVSQSTLNRLFKTHLHTSPKMYLETKRLSQARIYLKEGKSVIHASFLSGFDNYSNFIRLFKKRFDITPKEYKEYKI